jgi:hypothetical protein
MIDPEKIADAITSQVAEHHEFHDDNRYHAPRTGHAWKQRGMFVECDSCDHPHGFGLPVNQQLVGIGEDGMPIIRLIKY